MSLLAGLLSHIGMKDARGQPRRAAAEPPGGRGRGPASTPAPAAPSSRSSPDSALAKKPPQWVMAAELVETSRLWARTAARIEPEWAEQLAGHLLKRSYSEPIGTRARRGRGLRGVTLYGLPIVDRAQGQLRHGRSGGRRELFIRHALVEGDWETQHGSSSDNQRLLDEARELEDRARRRGIVVDDDDPVRVLRPAGPGGRDVGPALRHLVEAGPPRRRRTCSTFTPADLAGPAADEVRAGRLPGALGRAAADLRVRARARPDDGVTVDVPLASLGQVSAEEFGWQVPGRREELVTELIRSLPKELRAAVRARAGHRARGAGPARRQPRGEPARRAGAELGRIGGVAGAARGVGRVPAARPPADHLPGHGRRSASWPQGKDLDELRERLRPRLQARLTAAAGGLVRGPG